MNYFIKLVLLITLSTIVKTKKIFSCTEEKTIALTFDDGPHRYTRDLVDYMRKQPDVKITFFTLAYFHYPHAIDTEEYQEAMKLAHDSGYQIASHTYSHKIPDDSEEFKKVLTDNDDFIEKVTGDRPVYFRAPKGHCEEECQKDLDDWDYRLIQWDTDTNDWDLETSGSVEQRVKDSIDFLKKRFSEEKDSYLILMHDSQNYTVNEIAPWIIEESGMKEKGYKFVTVAECLGDKDGMYRSGKTYDDPVDTVIHSVVSGNDTTVVTNIQEEQNLNTSDALPIKFSFAYALVSLLFMIYILIN